MMHLILLPLILHLISASPPPPPDGAAGGASSGIHPTPATESCPPSCDLRGCPIVSPDECAGQIVKDECQCCPVCEPIEYSNFYDDDAAQEEEGLNSYVNATHKELCSKIKCSRLQTCNINIQGIPMCRCPSSFYCRKRNKKDVCGEDDVTYRSRCFLRMKECETNQRIRLKHEGPCFDDQTPKKQRKFLQKERRKERLEEKRKTQLKKRQELQENKQETRKEERRQLKKQKRLMQKKEKREERRTAKREEKKEERRKLKNDKKQVQNKETRRELKKDEKRGQNQQERKEKKKRQRRRLRRRSKARKNAKSKKNSDKLRRGRRCADEIDNSKGNS